LSSYFEHICIGSLGAYIAALGLFFVQADGTVGEACVFSDAEAHVNEKQSSPSILPLHSIADDTYLMTPLPRTGMFFAFHESKVNLRDAVR